jgi:hypothetical protein
MFYKEFIFWWEMLSKTGTAGYCKSTFRKSKRKAFRYREGKESGSYVIP